MLEVLLIALALYAVFYVVVIVPMKMAKTRDRSPFGWLLISLVLSPLIAIVALLVLGRALPASKV